MNPGSDEAIAAGCLCPVMDNAHGKGAYGGGIRGKDGELLFWKRPDCPLHGDPAWLAQEKSGS